MKGVETDEDKFAKHLERAAVLLEEQMVGNEEEEGGESEEDDGSDEEDELFHVEVSKRVLFELSIGVSYSLTFNMEEEGEILL